MRNIATFFGLALFFVLVSVPRFALARDATSPIEDRDYRVLSRTAETVVVKIESGVNVDPVAFAALFETDMFSAREKNPLGTLPTCKRKGDGSRVPRLYRREDRANDAFWETCRVSEGLEEKQVYFLPGEALSMPLGMKSLTPDEVKDTAEAAVACDDAECLTAAANAARQKIGKPPIEPPAKSEAASASTEIPPAAGTSADTLAAITAIFEAKIAKLIFEARVWAVVALCALTGFIALAIFFARLRRKAQELRGRLEWLEGAYSALQIAYDEQVWKISALQQYLAQYASDLQTSEGLCRAALDHIARIGDSLGLRAEDRQNPAAVLTGAKGATETVGWLYRYMREVLRYLGERPPSVMLPRDLAKLIGAAVFMRRRELAPLADYEDGVGDPPSFEQIRTGIAIELEWRAQAEAAYKKAAERVEAVLTDMQEWVVPAREVPVLSPAALDQRNAAVAIRLNSAFAGLGAHLHSFLSRYDDEAQRLERLSLSERLYRVEMVMAAMARENGPVMRELPDLFTTVASRRLRRQNGTAIRSAEDVLIALAEHSPAVFGAIRGFASIWGKLPKGVRLKIHRKATLTPMAGRRQLSVSTTAVAS